jgi:uncharacterized protein YkwD
MYRFLSVAVILLGLPACSLGISQPLSFGFGGGSETTASNAMRTGTVGLGGEPSTTRTKVAATQASLSTDHAPKGTWEMAPRGALADRDYSSTALDAERARDLINAYRKSKGLKPVTLNAQLTAAAKEHSRDLARWDRISHYGSDGSNPWDRVKRAGYNARVTAENVGTGQISIDEVMRGWQQSPGHNKNLLMPDVDNMGIALVQDPKSEFKTFWTLVLGSRQGA